VRQPFAVVYRRIFESLFSKIMKKKATVLLSLLLIVYSTQALAWGRTGHKLVAEIAYRYMSEDARKALTKYLDGMTMDEAGNWMDDQRSNNYYNFMRTWHYLDVEKGQQYQPSPERNAITVLNAAYNELKNYQTLKDKDIRRDLLLMFHLVGDIHQPLHVGYPNDKGGNDITPASGLVSGNLHSMWDTQILEYAGITIDSCLAQGEKLTPEQTEDLKKINLLRWYAQSRSYLDFVYSYDKNGVDKAYIDSAKVIIEKQIFTAGIRLASMVNEIFATGRKTASLPVRLETQTQYQKTYFRKAS